MEVLGGNGYVEEGPLARIYREMPVNSIWEGSGNIMCLDVLRALGKSQRTSDVLFAELEPMRGINEAYDAAFDRFARLLADRAYDEASARRVVRELVTLVQGSLLLRSGSTAMATAFCATRLSREAGWGTTYGEMPRACDPRVLVDRAWSATG
jgi:putative acyl-CoA dehydrogenase